EELAKEYGPSGQSIRNWVRDASRQDNTRAGELTAADREELDLLRKEKWQLREERERSCGRQRLSSRRRPVGADDFRSDRRGENTPSCLRSGPRARGVTRGLLRLAPPRRTVHPGRRRPDPHHE